MKSVTTQNENSFKTFFATILERNFKYHCLIWRIVTFSVVVSTDGEYVVGGEGPARWACLRTKDTCLMDENFRCFCPAMRVKNGVSRYEKRFIGGQWEVRSEAQKSSNTHIETCPLPLIAKGPLWSSLRMLPVEHKAFNNHPRTQLRRRSWTRAPGAYA